MTIQDHEMTIVVQGKRGPAHAGIFAGFPGMFVTWCSGWSGRDKIDAVCTDLEDEAQVTCHLCQLRRPGAHLVDLVAEEADRKGCTVQDVVYGNHRYLDVLRGDD